jgi:hypothetical protein
MLRQIVYLLLEGHNGIEIAGRIGVEPKRVYRAVEWLRKRVQQGHA